MLCCFLWLLFLVMQSQRSVCFSALVLHHAVGEFTTFLESCGLLRENQGAPEFKWIEALACHVPADSWNTLTILRKDKGKLKFVQVSLLRRFS